MALLACMGMLSTAVSGPVAVENGGFTVKQTGEQFFPVGFNYIDLRTENGNLRHDTFNPNRYDAATVSSNLTEIAAAGFNTVRVFIDVSVNTNGVVVAAGDSGLSLEYMQRVADFMEQAYSNDIYVIITFNAFSTTTRYYSLVNTVPNVTGMNQFYLNSGFIAAKRLYIRDFIQSLGQLAAPRLEDTVLAFDPQNEISYFLYYEPFVLSSGTLTPANGITYDLASDKLQLADEMAVYWMDQMAEEIHQQAPGALVDANMFTYDAVHRTIGNFNLFSPPETFDWKDRYPFRPEALATSGADFLDLHFYTGNQPDLQAELDSIEFGAVTNAWKTAGKPMIVGEFGAYKFALPTLSAATSWKREEVDVFNSLGFQGWLYWTYYTDLQPELWHAKADGGAIFDALEEGAKENYFGHPPVAEDLDRDGMADSWELDNFSTTNGLLTGADEDFDGDGMLNQAEYLAGTIPTNSASNFAITGEQVSVGTIELQWNAVPGKSYQVLQTGQLLEPYWSVAGDPVTGTGSVTSLSVPQMGNQIFYKVRLNR